MPFFLFIFLLFAFATDAQQTQPALISTAPVEKGEINPVKEYIGTVQYYAISKLAAERAGKVDSTPAEEGVAVKQEDTLMTLNRDALNYTIAASSARMAQQKHALDKAKRDYERMQALYKESAISLQRFQDAQTEYSAQTMLYNAYRADLNVLKEENKRSVVTAPFDGIILKRYVNTGEWVSAGTPLFDLASTRMEVAVNIPQAMVGYVKPGMEVSVSVEGKKYAGQVRVLVPQGNTLSRTFPVKIDLNYNQSLLGGMDAAVSLPTGDRQAALMIPRDAVIKREGRYAVFTVSDGKAAMVFVDVIGYSGINAGIKTDRLKPGDLVITRGNENIAPGRDVKVAPAVGAVDASSRRM